MSHSAISTPESALPSTGPLRQYELTNDDWKMSSIWSGSLPMRNGLRYLSMAVSTTRARCVNVAQPSPYNPASLVMTLTTTRRMPAGCVRMVFTSVMRKGGKRRPCAAPAGPKAGGACPAATASISGNPAAPAPNLNQSRRCMIDPPQAHRWRQAAGPRTAVRGLTWSSCRSCCRFAHAVSARVRPIA